MLVAKKFPVSPSRTIIKPTKYFFRYMNGVGVYHWVVIATKIKPAENFTGEIFYQCKIPDLRLTGIIHACL